MKNSLGLISVIPVVGRSENSDDDYEPTFQHRKRTTSKNSHSSVNRSHCEDSAGSEGKGSECDEPAVAKSQPRPKCQPCQNTVSNAYSGRHVSLWYI